MPDVRVVEVDLETVSRRAEPIVVGKLAGCDLTVDYRRQYGVVGTRKERGREPEMNIARGLAESHGVVTCNPTLHVPFRNMQRRFSLFAARGHL